MQQQSKTCQKLKSLLDVQSKYSNFFFDMDGVFWQGESPIKPAIACVNELQKNNKNVYFITNNSSRNRQTYVDRLAKFGITTEKKYIFCASSIIADYITSKLPEVKKAYVIGMEGICQELEEKGIQYLHASSIHNEGPTMTSEIFREMETDKDIGAVIVGIDYDFNYRKICYGSLCIQRGAHFMATNRDNYIKLDDRFMPGGGCCVDALARSVQKEPILTGKPNPFIVNELCQLYNLKKEESIMVGDNLETDIQLGINSGIDTYLVFTGVTEQNKFEQLMQDKNVVPTYCGEQL